MIKLLVADDEAIERKMLVSILEKEFSTEAMVRVAENGRQAVEIAAIWNPDVVLIDIEMPGINGIDAARRILDQQAGTKIIFVTAYGVFIYAQEAVKLGACDYILKPAQPEEVVRSVRRAVGQAESHRQLQALAPEAGRLAPGASGDKTAALMARVRKYLQHNYMLCDISLDSISAILNINASYFSSLFKRSMGINFVDYLTELRMNAARELLLDPLRSTAEVAGLVGYENANYFTRAFKKKTGMTPTEFRRSAAQSARDGRGGEGQP